MKIMFSLTITTVTEQLFAGTVRSATFPGADGELTVLKNHVPLITTLTKGVITVRTEGAEAETFPVERGLLEVSRDGAVVLV